jgi:hypothetical protein
LIALINQRSSLIPSTRKVEDFSDQVDG